MLVVCLVLLVSAIGFTPKTSYAGSFIRPAEGVYTDYFGTRGGKHFGVDIAKAGNVPIVAADDGTVSRSYNSSSYGETVFIKHTINGEQYETVYAHLRSGSRTVSVGQTVKKGTIIGYMGSTGHSSGQHLHFELHKGLWNVSKSNAINPIPYLKGSLITAITESSVQYSEYDHTFATLTINVPGGGNVNMYSNPGYGLKGSLANGGTYKVYTKKLDAKGNSYYDVGNNTWILSKYAKVTLYKATVNHTTNVNVYNAPGGAFKKRVSSESTYSVYGAKNGWYDIGQNTWIKSDYVKVEK